MPYVRIPSVLRSWTNHEEKLFVQGNDIASVLNHLWQLFPALKSVLLNPAGELSPFVNLFLNNQILPPTSTLQIAEKDEIAIISALSGG